MQVLKLMSLRFKNFKGIVEFLIEPNGDNFHILGDNATGKTTIIDGYYWLLFGKDSEGKADFQLKPVSKDGNEKHNLDTEIEGVFLLGEKPTTLLKRFKEKYTKKQGTATNEFTGHVTEHFIDGVPVKKREYESFISGIVDADIFKLVSNPSEFNKLHWMARRNIIIEMVGDVSDESIIEALYSSDKEKFQSITDMLNQHSIEDNKKKINAQKRDINKELLLIPARIDEVTQSIKDAELPDQVVKENLQISLDKELETLRKLQSNELVSEKRIRINELSQEAFDFKNEAIRELQKEITELEDKGKSKRNKLKNLAFNIKNATDRNKEIEEVLKTLREEFVSTHKLEDTNPTKCPVCDQEIPEDKIKEANEKFNQSKAEVLKENNERGKELKTDLEARQKSIAEEEWARELLLDEVIGITNSALKVEGKLKDIIAEPLEAYTSNEFNVLSKQIAKIESGSKEEISETQSKIILLRDSLADFETQEIAYNSAKSARSRISELENQEKTLAEQYEKLEAQFFLIQEFVVKKIVSLEGKIKERFKLARFRMFNIQINQGIEECCETIYRGVPFNYGLNAGAKINVGLDIINALSDHYLFQAPIFIDNKESVNELIETPTQVITLSVTKDPKLKIAA